MWKSMWKVFTFYSSLHIQIFIYSSRSNLNGTLDKYNRDKGVDKFNYRYSTMAIYQNLWIYLKDIDPSLHVRPNESEFPGSETSIITFDFLEDFESTMTENQPLQFCVTDQKVNGRLKVSVPSGGPGHEQ